MEALVALRPLRKLCLALGPFFLLLPSARAASTDTVEVSTAAPSEPVFTLSAVGDIRLNGPVGEEIARHGMSYPTASVKSLLRADIVFGNLECAVTARGAKVSKTWNFRAPPANVNALKKAGFTILNLANNHTMDYGPDGLLDTLAAVKKTRIRTIGAGRDRAEAERLLVISTQGVRVGFLGFTSTFPETAWAKRRRPGVNYSDFDRFPDIIRVAKSHCDVLVVSFHGGTELAPDPNDIQKAFAHVAVQSGADLVLGHHPHVIEPMELYKGKPIIYSLGNFLFVSPDPSTRSTAVARVTFSAKGVEKIEFIPIDINWGAPKPAGPEARKAVSAALDRLGALTQYPDRFFLSPEIRN